MRWRSSCFRRVMSSMVLTICARPESEPGTARERQFTQRDLPDAVVIITSQEASSAPAWRDFQDAESCAAWTSDRQRSQPWLRVSYVESSLICSQLLLAKSHLPASAISKIPAGEAAHTVCNCSWLAWR